MNLMIYSIQIFSLFQFVPVRDSYIPPFFLFSISCSFNQSFENSPFSAFFPRGPGRSGNCHAAGGRWVGATGGFLVDPVEPCRPLLRTPDHCHWRELPQVSFLSRQTRLLSRQKYACHDKTFVATKLCWSRDKHNFVATKAFVATSVAKLLLRQNYVCRNKRFVATKIRLSLQNICRDKNYTCSSSRQ